MDVESTIGEVVKPEVDVGIRNPRAEGGGETEDLTYVQPKRRGHGKSPGAKVAEASEDRMRSGALAVRA